MPIQPYVAPSILILPAHPMIPYVAHMKQTVRKKSTERHTCRFQKRGHALEMGLEALGLDSHVFKYGLLTESGMAAGKKVWAEP